MKIVQLTERHRCRLVVWTASATAPTTCMYPTRIQMDAIAAQTSISMAKRAPKFARRTRHQQTIFASVTPVTHQTLQTPCASPVKRTAYHRSSGLEETAIPAHTTSSLI